MTLSQRLQDELIEEAWLAGHKAAREGFSEDMVKSLYVPTAQAVATIAADLKGILPELRVHSDTHNSDYPLSRGYGHPCVCEKDPHNRVVNEMRSALDRYCEVGDGGGDVRGK